MPSGISRGMSPDSATKTDNVALASGRNASHAPLPVCPRSGPVSQTSWLQLCLRRRCHPHPAQ
eukprot:4345419-Lingulodinium_polyedra.AAC.1